MSHAGAFACARCVGVGDAVESTGLCHRPSPVKAHEDRFPAAKSWYIESPRERDWTGLVLHTDTSARLSAPTRAHQRFRTQEKRKGCGQSLTAAIAANMAGSRQAHQSGLVCTPFPLHNLNRRFADQSYLARGRRKKKAIPTPHQHILTLHTTHDCNKATVPTKQTHCRRMNHASVGLALASSPTPSSPSGGGGGWGACIPSVGSRVTFPCLLPYQLVVFFLLSFRFFFFFSFILFIFFFPAGIWMRVL